MTTLYVAKVCKFLSLLQVHGVDSYSIQFFQRRSGNSENPFVMYYCNPLQFTWTIYANLQSTPPWSALSTMLLTVLVSMFERVQAYQRPQACTR